MGALETVQWPRGRMGPPYTPWNLLLSWSVLWDVGASVRTVEAPMCRMNPFHEGLCQI
jgi:hypothetical protein